MIHGYQDRYSKIRPQSVFDSEPRIRKAETILAFLQRQI